jgi:hypothetical protein
MHRRRADIEKNPGKHCRSAAYMRQFVEIEVMVDELKIKTSS